MAKHWIQGALSKRGSHGALHRALGVKEGQRIPAAKMAAAGRSDNPRVRRMASLARTLGRLRSR